MGWETEDRVCTLQDTWGKSSSELEQMVFEVLSPVDFYTCSYVTLVYNQPHVVDF